LKKLLNAYLLVEAQFGEVEKYFALPKLSNISSNLVKGNLSSIV
jgi:hypothetical protein